MLLTRQMVNELLLEGISKKGSWNRKQLEALGVKWPLKKKWKHRLVGKDISEESIYEFLFYQNSHIIDK